MVSGTLFTGVFPPTPPIRPDESVLGIFDEAGPPSTQASSLSSIRPPSPDVPFFSRLKERHLALSCLADVLAPPSREPSPDFLRRVEEKQAFVEGLKRENRYLGDYIKLMCTRLRGTPLDIRTINNPGEGPNTRDGEGSGGRRMVTPPLVDTEEEWLAWEEEQAILEEVEKQSQSPPLEGKVEKWRNEIIPESQLSQTQSVGAPNASTVSGPSALGGVGRVVRGVSAAPSEARLSREQLPGLGFRVVKKVGPSADKGGGGRGLPVPLEREESIEEDLFVPQSQTQALHRTPLFMHGVPIPPIHQVRRSTTPDVAPIARSPPPHSHPRDDESVGGSSSHAVTAIELHADDVSESSRTISQNSFEFYEDALMHEIEQRSSLHLGRNRGAELRGPEVEPEQAEEERHQLPPSFGGVVASTQVQPARPVLESPWQSQARHYASQASIPWEADLRRNQEQPEVISDGQLEQDLEIELPSFEGIVTSTQAVRAADVTFGDVIPPSEETSIRDISKSVSPIPTEPEGILDSHVVPGSIPGESQLEPQSQLAYAIAAPPPLDGAGVGAGVGAGLQLGAQLSLILVPKTELALSDIVDMDQFYPTQSNASSYRFGAEDASQFQSQIELPVAGPSRLAMEEEEEESQAILPPPSFKQIVTSTQRVPILEEKEVFSALPREEEEEEESQEHLPELSFRQVITSTQAPYGKGSNKVQGPSGQTSKMSAHLPSTPFQQTTGIDLSSPPTTPTRRRRGKSDEGVETPKRARSSRESTPTTPSRTPHVPESVIEGESSMMPIVRRVREPRVPNTRASAEPKDKPTSPVKKFKFSLLNQPTLESIPLEGKKVAPLPSVKPKHGVEETPDIPSSPFGTPSASVPLPAYMLSSPPSMTKPRMTRIDPKPLEPESSGLLGMRYNSQFQIEDNVEAVSHFLKEDVWDEIEEYDD